MGSISLCQCTAVEISDDERAYFNEKYNECLCAKCMKELKSEYGIQRYKSRLKRILGVYFK